MNFHKDISDKITPLALDLQNSLFFFMNDCASCGQTLSALDEIKLRARDISNLARLIQLEIEMNDTDHERVYTLTRALVCMAVALECPTDVAFKHVAATERTLAALQGREAFQGGQAQTA